MSYWDNITEINARQEAKGTAKYGETLEDNITLTREQRIEHAQEETIDLLKYLEHLKQTFRDGITADDYQRAALRTAGEDRSKWLDNAVMGLCGEAGECVDMVKKHRFQGHDLDREALIKEVGDVLWYAALLCSALDITMGEAMQRNIDKLKQRYPDGFDKNRSINRVENQPEESHTDPDGYMKQFVQTAPEPTKETTYLDRYMYVRNHRPVSEEFRREIIKEQCPEHVFVRCRMPIGEECDDTVNFEQCAKCWLMPWKGEKVIGE